MRTVLPANVILTMQFLRSYWWLGLLMLIVVVMAIKFIPANFRKYTGADPSKKSFEWTAPNSFNIPPTTEGTLIRYGKELISNTSYYLGPKGKVAKISNGMNCQNCHLNAGTKYLGNNYSAVYSTYPRFRARSGQIETIYQRVNDCLERSLNGNPLDTNSREMKAIEAYIKWLGTNVPKKITPTGAGITNLPFLNRAASPEIGEAVYMQKCQRCHGIKGEGVLNIDSLTYQYPPLWGKYSYNNGAGLFRLSRFAGYVYNNMPFDIGTNKLAEPLTQQEAWDVAAYVNSQPRPKKVFKHDWPDITKKPVDHPFGPYADSFSEIEHKFGPFDIMHPKNK